MPVTLRQVAERAGRSIPTVSLILNNKGEMYSAQTRQRVLQAARELGYRPNASARATRSGRFGTVALLCSTATELSYLPRGLLEGLHDALAQHDLHLTFAKLPDDRLTNAGYVPKILREWSSDGLLINYTHHIPQAMLDLIHGHHIPSIWLNAKLEHDCVHADDVQGGELAVAYLLEQGCREIAYVDYVWGWDQYDQAHHSTRDRQAGYKQAMRAAGLQPRIIRDQQHITGSDRRAYTRAWMSRKGRPEAVVCYSIAEASAVLATCLELDLEWPRQMAVAAFGEAPQVFANDVVPTVLSPQNAMARAAVEAMLHKLGEPGELQAPVAVPYQMRLSMAPPATDRAADPLTEPSGAGVEVSRHA